jgi:hypothetical protein
MVDLHVFGIKCKINEYRKVLENHLGYKTKIIILRDVYKSKSDIIPEIPDSIALELSNDLMVIFGAEVALVYEQDPISKTL